MACVCVRETQSQPLNPIKSHRLGFATLALEYTLNRQNFPMAHFIARHAHLHLNQQGLFCNALLMMALV